MNSPADRFVMLQNELFLAEQDDRHIDHWFLGGDCAGWIYQRLLAADGIRSEMPPVMEDWGWTFTVLANGVKIGLNCWFYFQIEKCWLIGVESRKSIFNLTKPRSATDTELLVCDAIDAILGRDSRLAKRRWFEANPFELGIEAF